MDLKPTIDQLRGLSDILHRLYTVMDGENPDGPPQSASILKRLCTSNDGPIAQCTTELHTLERILDVENWPLSEADLGKALDNLIRLKTALDANNRSIF